MNWNEIDQILAAPIRSNILLNGRPSTGKSFCAQTLGGYAITIHDGTPADELRGHFVPKANGFEWHDGPALKAWREGVPLIINEIDKGSDEVKSLLHVICDNPETAKLTLPTGETVRPQFGFRVVATMNGTPEMLADALRSRFPIHIHVQEPHPNAIAKLPEEYRQAALSTATCHDEYRMVPLRSWYAFVELIPVIGQDLALTAVFGERREEILDALTLNRTVIREEL